MTRSLSILLPVHNAQPYLEHLVEDLLEVVPELTTDFEVLIVDNGSTDDTSDTAQQLVARYPQVDAIRNDLQLDSESALRPALEIARGDVIFLREEGTPLDLREIGKLWARMDGRQMVVARPASAPWRALDGSGAISAWEQAVLESIRPSSAARTATGAPGFKMLLRSVAQESTWWISRTATLIPELTAQGYSCEEISVRTEAGLPVLDGSHVLEASHFGDKRLPRRRRPNYLARILAMTSGN